MPRTIPESNREHADLALAVYVEELAARRRVLFVGDAASAVPERLSSVARSVEVVSPRTRARGTRRGGRILPRPWPSAQDARSWDLVLVPDLLWAGPPAPERIAEMHEWLTPRGVLVVGAEEREEGVGYEALYDLLARRFEWVRMLGQAPFAGWSVVDFAPATKELEVTFDGSLLGGTGEEPARFVALCASREVVLDPYAIVQVPAGREPTRESRAPIERPREDAQLQARLSQLEVQLRDRQDEVTRAGGRSEELDRELAAVRARVEHAERRLEQAQREIARGSQKLDEARSRADGLARELEETHGELAALRSAPESADTDYAQLETSLAERGRELIELRSEIERRGLLVRDLVEEVVELRAAGSLTPPPSGGGGTDDAERAQLRDALAAARRRAVDAEAALAEAAFRLDQVRGELALCKRARESEGAQASGELALAQGTVRGLASRLAETEEVRRQAEARLALAQDDAVETRNRIRELEREIAEGHDQLQHAVVRAHGAPSTNGTHAEPEQSDLARQLVHAEEELRSLRERSASERSSLEARVAELAQETARAAEDAERSARELASIRASSTSHAAELAGLRGEREGLRLRLSDAESAIASRPAALRTENGPAELAELHELRQRVELLGASVATWTQRAQAASDGAGEDASRASELAIRISTRDALIGRLQSEVADAASRRDALERRTRELDATIAQLRESLESARAVADVRADEERREAEQLAVRLAEAERSREHTSREHDDTRRALSEAREILSSIATGLDGTSSSSPPPASDGRLRDQVRMLQREAEDREMMLRSLTAQLQDRDDRLRAAERMRQGEGGGDETELRQRVLLTEERAVRLERELEQERVGRRAAEQSGGAAERDADLRRVHQLLGDRDAQLMLLEGRITQGDRESRAMRETFAQARAGLETLLGEIANDQRAEAADRIASMLRVLRRY